ncbi:MAG: hypothetical protein JJ992_05970, partial [Planctomycetes bacterium]|nr:hypothetical protein [Planctomycetota bacterium]
MAASKKFTKRLSVRLGAVFTVVALGAIAIAQAQLTGDTRGIEQPPTAAVSAKADPGDSLKPIPDPGEPEAVALKSPVSEPSPGVAGSPESPPTPTDMERSSVRLSADSESLVVRGNDGDEMPEPAEANVQDSPSFDFDRNALPEVPASPQFDAPSAYSMPADAAGRAVAAAVPPDDSNASALEAPPRAMAETPNELDRGLRDAARSAIADTPSPASIYGAEDSRPDAPAALGQSSVYDGTPAALAAPVSETADSAPPARLAIPESPSQQAPIPPTSTYDDPPARLGVPATSGGFAASASSDTTFSNSSTSVADEPAPSNAISQRAPAGAEAAHVAGVEGDGAPGAEALEGRQAPALTVEKKVAQEIQVGKETSFEVRIRNVGQVSAHDVIVLDRVPRGTRFVNATPQATEAPDGQLMWQLGTLEPGDETTVVMNVLPTSEGEIGSAP